MGTQKSSNLTCFLAAVSTLGSIGRKLPAPGTWGTGAALLLYAAWLHKINVHNGFSFALVVIALNILSVFICAAGERHFGRKDPGEVIFDEFSAFPLAFLGVEQFVIPGTNPRYVFVWTLLAFVLFRFFDIVKPFGIKKLQRIRGGVGIVIDDVAAALLTCACLHILHALTTLLPK
ncbi:MAG: phosphatidylglycerophosphatase A [Puniceicoccales bacterium]|jgi:phosphatidylglycerophosphatase A|nr:phosphatidylglycerophosphatase A [Puniceicoccales bacterium]